MEAPESISVDSSWVDSASYVNGTLTIRTKKGTTHSGKFPPSVWAEFKASPSKGQFVNQHLRKGLK